MKETSQLRFVVLAALFAALTAIGSYISIPVGPVPIVMANLFIFMAGLLLGKKWAATSIGIYLLLGLIGLPVFAGGASGVAVFAGPTGGFLLGYPVSAFIIALISSSGKTALWKDILAVLAGITISYLLGVPWLKYSLSMDWVKAIGAGMLPFIPGDLIKGAAAITLIKFLRPQIHE
jgi:biotin transport system substrate-specific component